MAEDNDKSEELDEEEEKSSKKTPSIKKKDWDKVSQHLKSELAKRKEDQFREMHERIWKEVDRQVEMSPMVKINRDGSEADMGWHNVFELGELSKASEDISSDVRRILFPENRSWFDAHSFVEMQFNEQGAQKVHSKVQGKIDGRLRSMMMQQQTDFGLLDRVELSVKEALHHGSFVAEIEWVEQQMVFGGTKVKTIGAPCWVPHSMWNCYPDPSPSVIGASMFYEGTMFVESYLPRYLCEKMVMDSDEDGWMKSQWKKVSKDEHRVKDTNLKDVKITKYWGDVNIERPDGDMYFPNHKAILMNGTIVYMAPNKTPYPPIIYRGYERLDVRDPYYTSPLIKMSPMQKLSTMLANKYIDGVELILEPPIVYDGNDPDFVLNGGPIIEPGSKVSTKGSVAFKEIQIGDPKIALEGLQLCLTEMKDKLGRPMKKVSADRKTALEVQKMDADEEISLINFVDKMEVALRTYLYMQHSMNLDNLMSYSFYCPDTDDEDFLRLEKKDLPKEVHFEVVGARGILGEQERTVRMTAVTTFASQSPLFQPLLDAKEILMQMYQDAGIKNPEKFISQQANMNPAALIAQLQQMKQILGQTTQQLQQEKSKNQVKVQKMQLDHQDKNVKLQTDHEDRVKKMMLDYDVKTKSLHEETMKQVREMMAEFVHKAVDQKHEKDLHNSTQQHDAGKTVLGMMNQGGQGESQGAN